MKNEWKITMATCFFPMLKFVSEMKSAIINDKFCKIPHTKPEK